MSEPRVFEVSATGYKLHLCSTEEQVGLVIKDIGDRKPDAKCSSKVFDLPYLCYDDEKPLVVEADYELIDLNGIQMKFCVPDLMSIIHALNNSIKYAQGDLVFLTSTLYCSVLSVQQATQFKQYLLSNYERLKKIEDQYFELNDAALKKLDAMKDTLAGSKKTKQVVN